MNEEELAAKEENRKWRIKRNEEKRDMKKLLESPGNRYLLWRFFEYCKLFNADPPMDGTTLAIKAGIRNAGLWMLNEAMEARPDAVTLIYKEASEREKR